METIKLHIPWEEVDYFLLILLDVLKGKILNSFIKNEELQSISRITTP